MDFKDVFRTGCPGPQCLEHSFDFVCDESQGNAIGNAIWNIENIGSQQFCPLSELFQKMVSYNSIQEGKGFAPHLASQFATCQEAKESLYQKFLGRVSEIIIENKKVHENPFLFPSVPQAVSESLSYSQVAAGFLAVGLCVYGLWKCYQNRDTIATEAKKIFQ